MYPFPESGWAGKRNIFTRTHNAMATTFGICLDGVSHKYASEASFAAFSVIDRLEQLLSRFIDNSETSAINRLMPGKSVKVSEDMMACMKDCIDLYHETGGCFDITAGNIIERYKNSVRRDGPEKKYASGSGINRLRLSEHDMTITVHDSAVNIDLGGYAKGYALEKSAAVLRDWDINRFMLHGGYSTILAGLPPQNEAGWPVSVSHPFIKDRVLKKLDLAGISLSGSGLRKGMHIVDPRSGKAVQDTAAVWVMLKNAARCDALSTAFMIMNKGERELYIQNHTDTAAMCITQNNIEDILGNWAS